MREDSNQYYFPGERKSISHKTGAGDSGNTRCRTLSDKH
jgi:hypothetical protein